MPQLTDAKHEAFAVAYASGQSQTQAAITAGFTKAPHNVGSRLNKRSDVQRRVYELQAMTASVSVPESTGNVPANGEITAERTKRVGLRTNDWPVESKRWRTEELVSLYYVTRATGDYGVSHACLKTLSLVHGDMDNTPANARLADTARVTAMGVGEIHTMLRQLMGNVPASERPALLAQAPELADIVAESCTPTTGV
jgi:hypothetical protein